MKRLKKIALWVAYGLFGIACYLVFLLASFPVDLLLDQGLAQVRTTGWNIEAAKAETTVFPPGVKLSAVSVSHKDWGPDSKPIRFEYVKVTGALWSLRSEEPSAGFDIGIAGGSVAGSFSYTMKKKILELNASVDDLALAKLPGADKLPVPTKGTLSGDVQLVWNDANVNESTGRMLIDLDGWTIGPAEQPFKLPVIQLGAFHGELHIDKGKALVTHWESSSEDLQTDSVGSITLNPRMERMRSNLLYRFKLSPKLASDATLKTLLMIANPAKAEDGYFYYRITGPFSSPTPTVSKRSAEQWTQEVDRIRREANIDKKGGNAKKEEKSAQKGKDDDAAKTKAEPKPAARTGNNRITPQDRK